MSLAVLHQGPSNNRRACTLWNTRRRCPQDSCIGLGATDNSYSSGWPTGVQFGIQAHAIQTTQVASFPNIGVDNSIANSRVSVSCRLHRQMRPVIQEDYHPTRCHYKQPGVLLHLPPPCIEWTGNTD